MNTFTSTLSHSGMIPSSQSQKIRLPRGTRTSFKTVRTNAATHLASRLERVHTDSAEKFYQDHMIAIFMGLFFETAMAPLLGTLGIFLYGHLVM